MLGGTLGLETANFAIQDARNNGKRGSDGVTQSAFARQTWGQLSLSLIQSPFAASIAAASS